MKKNKGLANEGYGGKEEETPEKPYPCEKFRKEGNEEMRRKNANARKINRSRQLYQHTKSRERAIEEEKPYL